MRIGVLGGSFDPPHVGHLVVAEEARVQLDLARVVFVPAGLPPHKQDRQLTPAHHRVEMTTRALAANPYFHLSAIDTERSGPSYSVETVRLFRADWGREAEIFFIVGLDMLADLPNWHRPEELIQLCRLAVADRPGYTVDMLALEVSVPGVAARVDWVSVPLLEISSTDLRCRIGEGRSVRYYVPPAVEAYIRAHGLYV
jgi:nicotinate-nucleotide adenylyltransferase